MYLATVLIGILLIGLGLFALAIALSFPGINRFGINKRRGLKIVLFILSTSLIAAGYWVIANPRY